jgi:hypothetical protein
MRCNCENEACEVGHETGDCGGDSSVKTVGGSICEACAQYMPDGYIVRDDDAVGVV